MYRMAKQRIELTDDEFRGLSKTLKDFEGRRLERMYRYLGFQAFNFGETPPPNADLEPRDIFITACCPWSVSRAGIVFLTSTNFGPGRERRDQTAQWFYNLQGDPRLQVLSTSVGRTASLTLALSDEISISITPEDEEMPDGPSGEDDDDWYRSDCYLVFGVDAIYDFRFDLLNPLNHGLSRREASFKPKKSTGSGQLDHG